MTYPAALPPSMVTLLTGGNACGMTNVLDALEFLAVACERVDLTEPGYIARRLQGPGHLERALRSKLTADRRAGQIVQMRAVLGSGADDAALNATLRATCEDDTKAPCIASALAYDQRASHSLGVGFTQRVNEFRTAKFDLLQVTKLLDQAEAVWQQVRAAADLVLNQGINPQYLLLEDVPPPPASPCGVLRLTTPIVPGAPGFGPSAGQELLALAA
ncbi:hypothetical protein R1T08_15000 [Streptomyces sp. SBC-4]|nr:hypothetical protein [Streptomyces sp. SBC-4]MDV5145485.1 hypothetical protein [Streptomyces sp. SBC-4]